MAKLPFVINDGKWHHICVTWTTRDGVWEAYQDGTQGGSGENLAPYHPIKPQGVLVLGQEQVLCWMWWGRGESSGTRDWEGEEEQGGREVAGEVVPLRSSPGSRPGKACALGRLALELPAGVRFGFNALIAAAILSLAWEGQFCF